MLMLTNWNDGGMVLINHSLSTLCRCSKSPTPWRRFNSSSVRPRRAAPEVVHVNVGGRGHVALSVLKPHKSPATGVNDVLVLLPPGPPLQSPERSSQPLLQISRLIHALSNTLPTTALITLNYRLSFPEHRFPAPIHDAATAFTYIANPNNSLNNGKRPTISLFGSHTGGSLALMLALTNPNLIESVVALEPLVDYVGIDERKSMAKDSATLDAQAELLALRSRLFPSPSAYFDPFASPLLFLRAPGRDTPNTHSSTLTDGEGEYDSTPVTTDADAFGPYDDDMTSAIAYTPPKRRKVIRRWPPVGRAEDVMLPATTIVASSGAGLNGILCNQAKEMTEALRRACFWGREKGLGDDMVKMKMLEEGKDDVHQLIVELIAQRNRQVGQPTPAAQAQDMAVA